MAQGSLRSGKLEQYRVVGDEGAPIYRAADQIREAIRLQIGEDAANRLAIPKVNDAGDRIDWYSPQQGLVIPWTAADAEERVQAKDQLIQVQAKLRELSTTMHGSEEHERKTFGKLLGGALTFPSEDCVYIVDGQPVITFWGFSDPEHPVANAIDLLSVPTAPTAAAIDPSPDAPTAATPVAVRRARPWWHWLLGLLLLLLLLALLLRYCAPMQDLPRQADAETVETPTPDDNMIVTENEIARIARDDPRIRVDRNGRRYVVGPNNVRYYDQNGDGVPDLPGELEGPAVNEPTDALPEQETVPEELVEQPLEDPLSSAESAEQTSPLPEDGLTPSALEETPPSEEPSSADPAGPNAAEPSQSQPGVPPSPGAPLEIPADAAQTGSADFLDGGWKANSGLMDSDGRPVEVEYDFSGGKGQVTYKQANGQSCVGDVEASMQGAGVSIASAGEVVCPNGNRYTAPTVVCEPGANGATACSGGRGDDAFKVEMNRRN